MLQATRAVDRRWDGRLRFQMPPTAKAAGKAAASARAAEPWRRDDAMPRLNTGMACDTAFRIVARRALADLTANNLATREGDPAALHQMRIALTRLRTAILFFSPMVKDPLRKRIQQELKWLNSHLGMVRDIDVASERLRGIDKTKPQDARYYRSWDTERAECHRRLVRALRSARYRHLVKSTSNWIENGPWSTRQGNKAARERGTPIAQYSVGKLARWQKKLVKKSRKLLKMDAETRHRLRLLNKKLTYSIEFFDDLSSDKNVARQSAGLKHLRRAQRSLGQLNDDTNGHALAATLQRDGVHLPLQFLGPKREKRLLRAAAAAYRKLAALRSL
ncbi:MAG TPA: CHAD domain-containing protein [Bradyrhizobium sp.]